jgi:MFS family permease
MSTEPAIRPDAYAAMTNPERGHSFWLLWSANSASNLGDGLYQFILPVLAIQLTNTPSRVAGVHAMLTISWLMFALVAGSIVDRVDRRRLLLVVNLGRIVLLALLSAAVVAGNATIALLYGVALLLGMGETLADTALTAVVPAVALPERLDRANAYITGAQTVTNTFIGPPLAGYLASLGAAFATGAGVLMYAIAGGALALMRGTYRAATPAAASALGGYWQHLTEGMRFLWRHRLIRALTLFTAAMNVCWAAWTALLILYSVAPGPMNLSTFAYGVLLTLMAIGGLLGSMFCERVQRLIGTRAALTIDLIGTIALVGVPALTTNVVAVGAAMFLAGVGSSIWVILVATLRQRLVPDDLLGRVYSASRMISWGVGPLGALLAGLAADIWGIRAVFALCAAGSTLLLVLFLAVIRPAALQVGARQET